MGTFRVDIVIGDPDGERWESVNALVDAGATYTWLPREVLERLGVQPQLQREFRTADERVVELEMGIATARWDWEALPTLVAFGNEGSLALLGAYTLEGFGLAADPINRLLIRVQGLAMSLG